MATSCVFNDNYAGTRGGAISIDMYGEANIDNCLFYTNTADDHGGAISINNPSDVIIQHCTLVNNSARYGGGISCFEPSLQVSNSIIAFSTEGESIYAQDVISLACCDLFGNEGGDWVASFANQLGLGGNISENPYFCDRENDDFLLAADSPCTPFSQPNEYCDLIGARQVGCGELMSVSDNNHQFYGTLLTSTTPNPFTNSTQIAYSIPGQNKAMATVDIYDLSGRLIRRLVNTEHAPGPYSISWDGTDSAGGRVPAGAYFYHLAVGNQMETKRALLIR